MVPIRAAVITCSDRCFREGAPDLSGQRLMELLRRDGIEDIAYRLVPDDPDRVRSAILEFTDRERRDLIITVGGTGFGPRDCTPEVTASLLERRAPGLMEYARSTTGRDHPRSFTSRGLAGTRGRSLVLNFPGSPRAVVEYWSCLKDLVAHALGLIRGETPHQDPRDGDHV